MMSVGGFLVVVLAVGFLILEIRDMTRGNDETKDTMRRDVRTMDPTRCRVDLNRTDVYPDMNVPDEHIEIALKVLRTMVHVVKKVRRESSRAQVQADQIAFTHRLIWELVEEVMVKEMEEAEKRPTPGRFRCNTCEDTGFVSRSDFTDQKSVCPDCLHLIRPLTVPSKTVCGECEGRGYKMEKWQIGHTTPMQLSRKCGRCGGVGLVPVEKAEACKACEGRGWFNHTIVDKSMHGGVSVQTISCRNCKGTGMMQKPEESHRTCKITGQVLCICCEKCKDCGGKGWHHETGRKDGLSPCVTCLGTGAVKKSTGMRNIGMAWIRA